MADTPVPTVRIAAGDRGRARVGCSGWSYRDWRGIVYPAEPARRSGSRTTRRMFDTVELNSTFYRLPTVRAVERWAAAGAAGLPVRGQGRRVRHPSQEAAGTRHRGCPTTSTGSERLGDSLGPNLVQLPPRWKRNTDRLDELLGVGTDVDALGGRDPRPVVAARRDVSTVLAPARRRAVRPRPAPRPPLRADDRLDVRALPRPHARRPPVPRSPTGHGGWAVGETPGR